jgi:hypothetical protein
MCFFGVSSFLDFLFHFFRFWGFFGFWVHPRVKNKTRTRTRFYMGRVQVWVTGVKMHPNPHPSGAKPAGDPKPEPILPSLPPMMPAWLTNNTSLPGPCYCQHTPFPLLWQPPPGALSLCTILSLASATVHTCRGLKPWVPWVAGYGPKLWIRPVASSGKRLGNHTPRTGYSLTTPS